MCPQHAIAVSPGQVLIFAELCRGCGACSLLCPRQAITEVGRPVGAVEVGKAAEVTFIHGRLNLGGGVRRVCGQGGQGEGRWRPGGDRGRGSRYVMPVGGDIRMGSRLSRSRSQTLQMAVAW